MWENLIWTDNLVCQLEIAPYPLIESILLISYHKAGSMVCNKPRYRTEIALYYKLQLCNHYNFNDILHQTADWSRTKLLVWRSQNTRPFFIYYNYYHSWYLNVTQGHFKRVRSVLWAHFAGLNAWILVWRMNTMATNGKHQVIVIGGGISGE